MISKIKDLKLAVIGLGYVGLPLALEFSKKRKVIGFDTLSMGMSADYGAAIQEGATMIRIGTGIFGPRK